MSSFDDAVVPKNSQDLLLMSMHGTKKIGKRSCELAPNFYCMGTKCEKNNELLLLETLISYND